MEIALLLFVFFFGAVRGGRGGGSWYGFVVLGIAMLYVFLFNSLFVGILLNIGMLNAYMIGFIQGDYMCYDPLRSLGIVSEENG